MRVTWRKKNITVAHDKRFVDLVEIGVTPMRMPREGQNIFRFSNIWGIICATIVVVKVKGPTSCFPRISLGINQNYSSRQDK